MHLQFHNITSRILSPSIPRHHFVTHLRILPPITVDNPPRSHRSVLHPLHTPSLHSLASLPHSLASLARSLATTQSTQYKPSHQPPHTLSHSTNQSSSSHPEDYPTKHPEQQTRLFRLLSVVRDWWCRPW